MAYEKASRNKKAVSGILAQYRYLEHPYRLHIDNSIAQLIDYKLRQANFNPKRITVFVDFDSALIGFHTTENDFSTIVQYIQLIKDFVLHAVEYIARKLIEQYITLKNTFPDKQIYVILFSNTGRSKYHIHLHAEYKMHRRIAKAEQLLSKLNVTLKDLQDAIFKNFVYESAIQITEPTDFVKALKTLIKEYVSVLCNTYLPNHAFIVAQNLESDLIPYLILRQKYNTESLYLILSSDKDFAQLTAYSDYEANNIWLIRKVYRFAKQEQQESINPEDDLVLLYEQETDQSENEQTTKTTSYTLIHDKYDSFAIVFGPEYVQLREKLLLDIVKTTKDKSIESVLNNVKINPLFSTLYLAITGDQSDNIPSCKLGLGKITLFDIAYLLHLFDQTLIEHRSLHTYATALYKTAYKLSSLVMETEQERRLFAAIKRTRLGKYVASDKLIQFRQLLETYINRFTSKVTIEPGDTITMLDVLVAQNIKTVYKELKSLHIHQSNAHLCFLRNMYLVSFELAEQVLEPLVIDQIMHQLRYLLTDYRKAKVDFDTLMLYKVGLATNINPLLATLDLY